MKAKPPVLILVSGLPSSGKSTIAEYLSRHLRAPLFTRDMFKEIMFDTFGWDKDQEWLDKIGFVATKTFFKLSNLSYVLADWS
jgi:tRNA uridine 5-carbamoylmethylation protein Kti12